MQKHFYIMYNVGKAKYLVNFHNGLSKHDDGSDFFDVRIFKNKLKLDEFIKILFSEGYNKI